MKTLLCSWLLAFFCLPLMLAQDTISVSYKLPDDLFMYKLMEFQGINGFDVVVKGNMKRMPYKVYMVRCKDGKAEEKLLNKDIPCEMDSVQHFYFFAQAESADTAHISITYRVTEDLHIPIATKNCILMETLPVKAYTVADRIPLIAYTTGHETKMEFNGQIFTAIDFCGVRFSKTHPSEWYEKFNIKDYIYFEIEFQPSQEVSGVS